MNKNEIGMIENVYNHIYTIAAYLKQDLGILCSCLCIKPDIKAALHA